MSWSVGYVGKPEDVARALAIHAETFEQSQREFESVKGHLIGLVNANFGLHDSARVYVQANGSGRETVVEGGNTRLDAHSLSVKVGITYVDKHENCKFVPEDGPPA